MNYSGGSFKTHPILCLLFHGEVGEDGPGIMLHGETSPVSLDAIAKQLKGACDNRIVYFGSCSVMKTDKRNLKRFLDITEAVAVCGYKTDVPWLPTAAFELLILGHLQNVGFTLHGIKKFEKEFGAIANAFKNAFKPDLEFRIVMRDSKFVG